MEKDCHPAVAQISEAFALLEQARKELEWIQKKSPILSGFRRRRRLIKEIRKATEHRP